MAFFDPLTAKTGLDAGQRSLRARAAAYAMHAQGSTNTAPATRAAVARFEQQVDPDHVLTPEVRARRAGQALRSHMAGLALKASKARSRQTKSEPATVSETSAAGSATEGHGNDRPSA